MKKFTLFLFIIVLGTTSVVAQKTKTKGARTAKKSAAKMADRRVKSAVEKPQQLKFDPTRNPSDDLQAIIGMAQTDGKRIILDVGGEWCGWCHEMDDFIARHAELNKLIEENFIWLKINFSEENENKEFLSKYPQIKGFPHLFVLDGDGKLLVSKDTAQLEDGGKSYNLKKFTEFILEYAAKKDAAK